MAEDKKEKQSKQKNPADAAKAEAARQRKANREAAAAQKAEPDIEEKPSQPAPPPRLIAHYREKIVPELQQKFGVKNVLATPRLEKIVISMGIGRFGTEGGEGRGKIQQAEKELGVIAGQRPVRCKSKKSVANFKLREGMDTGLKVTLRGNRMYEFLDRLISLAIPRVKDFRGLNPDGFDKNGNYNFGFTEQTVFPEVNTAEVTFQQGMNITMVTTARTEEQGRELLKGFGFPFKSEEDKNKK